LITFTPSTGLIKVAKAMLDNEPQINFDSVQPVSPSTRRLQLLFALTLLITALVLVVLKNRQFWSDLIGLEGAWDQTTSSPIKKTIKKGEQRFNLPLSRKTRTEQSASSDAQAQTTVMAKSNETVLSPLRVDVTYSSGQHQTLLASNSAIHIDPQQNSQALPALLAGSVGVGTGASGAGVRVRFSGQTVEILGRPAEPVYPLLAQQTNVQGSVVLQARIKEDGTVETLEVISGPGMLTAAALEAVKQWHFKPHYDAGRAVPAETRITVNFSISTQ
jgi:TonB family protein